MQDIQNNDIIIIADSKNKDAINAFLDLKAYNYHYFTHDTVDKISPSLFNHNDLIVILQHSNNNHYDLNLIDDLHHEHTHKPTIIVMSETDDTEHAIIAIKKGANDFIYKPNWHTLKEIIAQLSSSPPALNVTNTDYVDRVTGLLSRTSFQQQLTNLLHGPFIQKDEHTLIILDVDSFNVVNNTAGHHAGDKLLCDISNIIKKNITQNDICARLGSDEFGIMLKNCNIDQALEISQKICSDVTQLRFIWESKLYHLSLCAGVTKILFEKSASTLLNELAQACTSAKQKGRGHVKLYHVNDCDIKKHKEDIAWASDIPKILEQEKIVLFYQPIIPLSDTGEANNYYHGEILLRVETADGSLLSPQKFILAAEEFGLMTDVDKYIINRAITYLLDYHALYETQKNAKKLFLSVNLSGLSLRDGQFLDYLLETIAPISNIPHKLCFEITETAAITDQEYAMYFIKMLKIAGCEISLDDFGSGFASFNYLKTLDVDYVKIDGSFVSNMIEDKLDGAIIHAITQLCKTMKLKTIAEFVENKKIEDKLKEIGVNYAQGYYYSKPFPLPPLSKNTLLSSLCLGFKNDN